MYATPTENIIYQVLYLRKINCTNKNLIPFAIEKNYKNYEKLIFLFLEKKL